MFAFMQMFVCVCLRAITEANLVKHATQNDKLTKFLSNRVKKLIVFFKMMNYIAQKVLGTFFCNIFFG